MLLVPILAGCLILLRRRLRRRRLENAPPSESETRTLLSTTNSRDGDNDDKAPPFKKPFDIENPAPVYLEKKKRSALPHLKTLHLLSRTSSATSSTSTLVANKKDATNPRIYITQPSIPSHPVTSNIYYRHDDQPEDHTPSLDKRAKAASTQTLPDGFESFIYSLRSPQAAIEDTVAKRLSVLSAISTIRFAKDNQGWVPRRASVNSIGHSTVFDDGASNSPSPPAKDDHKRHSVKSRRRLSRPNRKGSPASPPVMTKFDNIEEEITYQPTPLAPPPAQIRSRSVTPNASISEYNVQMEELSTKSGRQRGLRRPPGLEAPGGSTDVAVKGGSLSILHSAVKKGKISQQDVESTIGMRISMSP